MRQVKKLDVILPEAVMRPFLDLLGDDCVLGYTVATGLAGRTHGGLATAGLTDATVTVICRANGIDPLLSAIAAFLARFGGLATASDATGINIG